MTDEQLILAKRVLVRIVAKAICKSRSCEGGACCQWPGNGGRHAHWNRLRRECPVDAGGYDNAALDAILAYQKALGIAERDGCAASSAPVPTPDPGDALAPELRRVARRSREEAEGEGIISR